MKITGFHVITAELQNERPLGRNGNPYVLKKIVCESEKIGTFRGRAPAYPGSVNEIPHVMETNRQGKGTCFILQVDM